MSIIPTVLSWGKTALSAIVPGAAIALRVAPWAIAGALAVALVVEHYRLNAADADMKTAQTQTAEAVQKCQAEASQQAAAESAATVQQQQKAQAAASAAEIQLFAQRSAAQTMAGQVQQKLGQQLGMIATQGAQPGQDGSIPPVLAEMFP